MQLLRISWIISASSVFFWSTRDFLEIARVLSRFLLIFCKVSRKTQEMPKVPRNPAESCCAGYPLLMPALEGFASVTSPLFLTPHPPPAKCNLGTRGYGLPSVPTSAAVCSPHSQCPAAGDSGSPQPSGPARPGLDARSASLGDDRPPQRCPPRLGGGLGCAVPTKLDTSFHFGAIL